MTCLADTAAKEPGNISEPASSPRIFDRAATSAALPFDRLIPALRDAFVADITVPLRHQHAVPEGMLLLMPAWHGATSVSRAVGIKIVSVFPDNGRHGLNAVFSTYLLCAGETGLPIAIVDGNELTGRRTVGASALAASFMAREDATKLLVVGAGHIASMLPEAYRAVRPISEVSVWNPRPARAAALAAMLRAKGFDARAEASLEAAVGTADIVACATLATEPLIRGAWLRPGTHLDLIGGFRPTMREADDNAIRAARVVIDGPAALTEAGDLTQPIESGAIAAGDIAGELADLCRGTIPGRTDPTQITLFKSVGTALEDLAAAMLVYREG